MSVLPSIKALRLLNALLKYGFFVVRIRGSHRFLRHPDGRSLMFAFHDRETVGPRILSKLVKDARMTTEELHELL